MTEVRPASFPDPDPDREAAPVPPPPRPQGVRTRRAVRLARTLRLTLEVLAAAIAGLAVLTGVLAWRLSAGPITVDFLTPVIESALNDGDDRVRVDIAETVLTWGGFHQPVEVRARQVRAIAEDGRVVAAVPELGLGFSTPALLHGRLLPTRLDLIRPQVRVLRTREGRFAFDIREDGPGGGGSAQPAPSPDTAGDAGSIDPGAALLDALRHPPDLEGGGNGGPLAALGRVAITGATLVVEDHLSGISLAASQADIVLARGEAGIQGEGRVSLALGDRTARLEARLDYGVDDGVTQGVVEVHDLEPAALAALAPGVAHLLGLSPDSLPLEAAALPLGGRIDLTLDAGFHLRSARYALTAGPGEVRLPALSPEPVSVAFLEARGEADPVDGWLSLEELFLDLGGGRDGGRRHIQASGTLHRDAGAVRATLRLGTAIGDRTGSLEAVAEQRDQSGAHVEIRLDDLVPARLATLAPALPSSALSSALAAVERAELPLSGWIEADLGPDFRPTAARAEILGGVGRLGLPELYPEPLAVHGLSVQARIDDGGRRAVVEDASVDLGGPVLSVSATAVNEGDQADLLADVMLRHLPMDDLARFWPAPVAPNPRGWITENLSQGRISEAWVTVAAKVPFADPGALDPVRIDGGLEVEGATVRYLHPLPPVTGVSASARIDGRTLALDLHGGALNDLKLSGDSTVVITEIGSPQEWIAIDLGITGPVPTAMAVLDHPPLGYAAKLEIDPAKTRGEADTRLKFRFPLLVNLSFDQIEVSALSRLRGVAIDGVLGGRGVSHGDLTLDLVTKGMTVKGKARVAGVPAVLDWKENFTPVDGVRSRLAVKGEVGDADRVRLGLDLAPHAVGPIGVDAVMMVDAKRRMTVKTGLDLAKCRLTLDELSWDKPVGVPGTAGFTVQFKDGRMVALTGLTAETRALRARGGIDFDEAGRLARVQLTEFIAGRTDLKVEARALAGGGWAVRLDGARLDARSLTQGGAKDGDPEAGKAGRPPLDLSFQVGDVLFGDDRRVISHAVGTLRRVGAGWDSASLEGRAEGTVPVKVRYMPEGDGRRLEMHADDLGAVLRALDINDKIKGGKVSISGMGWPNKPGRPVEGQIDLGEYQVLNAPVLARLLNAMSLSGLAELLSGGSGLGFGRLDGQFRLDDQGLHLSDVRTAGGALGLTVAGRVDLDRETADLQGSIVPIYTLNRILGAIPVLGDLLSGGQGQGLFAATYRVHGPFDDLTVAVNPLAVLAPGFLRNLFFLGGDASR